MVRLILLCIVMVISALSGCAEDYPDGCPEENIGACVEGDAAKNFVEIFETPSQSFGDYIVQVSETFLTCCICGYSCTETGCVCKGTGQTNHDGSPWCDPGCTLEKVKVLDAKGEVVFQVEDKFVGVIDLKRPDKAFAVSNGRCGASFCWPEIHIFSVAPEFKKIATIDRPVSQAWANDWKCGSDLTPDGFYKDDENNLLIDTVVWLEEDADRPFSHRRHNVVTLKVGTSSVSTVARRLFDMDTYKRQGKLLNPYPCAE